MVTVDVRLFAKRAATAVAASAVLIAFCSCDNSKLYSNPQMTASQTESQTEETSYELTYDSVSAYIKQYDEELNLYMAEHISEATVKEGDGSSYAGIPAYTVYTVSADGKYSALQMEKTFDDRTVMDEYFDMGDAMLFARTTLYSSGEFAPVEKYFITDGIVYKVDSQAKTLEVITEVDSADAAQYQSDLDMYFSFDEIVAIYG